MNNTVDTVAGLRQMYLRNNGILIREEILSLFDSIPLQTEELEETMISIQNDMCLNTPFALTLKEVNRFLTLKKAIDSKKESSVCRAVDSQLQILDESLSNHSAKCEDALEAACSIPNQISTFAEKLPKLVKAVNEYAGMCEGYFANTESARRLRANIYLLPLAQKAHEIVEKNAALLTIDVYWLVAETLYKDAQSMFEGNLYYFGIVRDFLNIAIIEQGMEVPRVSIPEKFTLPNLLVEEAKEEETVAEEPVVEEVTEEAITEEVAEEPVVEEVTEEAITEEVAEEPVVEEVTEEVITEEVAEEPVVEKKIEEEAPKFNQEVPKTLSPESRTSNSSPAKPSLKKYILFGVAGLVIAVAATLFFLPNNNKPQEVTPNIIETGTATPAATPETATQEQPATPAPTVEQKAPKETPEKKAKEKPQPTAIDTEKKETKGPVATTEKDKSSTSFDATMKRAKAGNADAQYRIGQYYESGNEVKADTFEAITWYRKAKTNGSKEAEKRLTELGY